MCIPNVPAPQMGTVTMHTLANKSSLHLQIGQWIHILHVFRSFTTCGPHQAPFSDQPFARTYKLFTACKASDHAV